MISFLVSILFLAAPAPTLAPAASAPTLDAPADGRVSLVAPRRDAQIRRPTLRQLAGAVLGGIQIEAVGAGQVTEVVAAFGIAHEGRLRTAVVSDPLQLSRDGLLHEGSPVRTLLDAFEDPSFGFEDPSFGFEAALRSVSPAQVGFENPIISFEDPSFGFEDPSFGFRSPREALQAVWDEGARAFEDGPVLVAAILPADARRVRVTGSALLVGLNVNEARPR